MTPLEEILIFGFISLFLTLLCFKLFGKDGGKQVITGNNLGGEFILQNNGGDTNISPMYITKDSKIINGKMKITNDGKGFIDIKTSDGRSIKISEKNKISVDNNKIYAEGKLI